MKLTISDSQCEKHGLTFPQTLYLLLVKTGVDIPALVRDMKDKEMIREEGGRTYITQRWDDECDAAVLGSDPLVPDVERTDALAEKLMELFPKGKKEGTNCYWRCNKREVSLKLQKFFKLYKTKCSDDDIIEAARKYVDSFNGNYTHMRLLKYFILKNVRVSHEDSPGYAEEVSDLAAYLAGEDVSDDWTSGVV